MKAYSITLPDGEQNAILFNSPHSGTCLPERFLKQLAIDPDLLLYSGDILVDRLIQDVPRFGATVFTNHFARIYVDTNRSDREIDANMFHSCRQRKNFDRSGKVACGFGLFSSKAYNGQDIYAQKLDESEIAHRLNQIYRPVHQALSGLLNRLRQRHGFYILIDCHSMPSYGFINRGPSGGQQPDLVIGNCFGASCPERLTRQVANFFLNHGLNIAHNTPYAGGFNTREYGRPGQHRHALQLEFNRALYMDEKTLTPNEGFLALQALLTGLGENLNENLPQLSL